MIFVSWNEMDQNLKGEKGGCVWVEGRIIREESKQA
jgi:hypothetical protein